MVTMVHSGMPRDSAAPLSCVHRVPADGLSRAPAPTPRPVPHRGQVDSDRILKFLLEATRGAIPRIDHLRDGRELCSPAVRYCAGSYGRNPADRFAAASNGERAPSITTNTTAMMTRTGSI